MKEFRFIGNHAEHLDNGAPIEPGGYTGPINERAPQNASLIRDGQLVEVSTGTADAHADGDTKKVSRLNKTAEEPTTPDENKKEGEA